MEAAENAGAEPEAGPALKKTSLRTDGSIRDKHQMARLASRAKCIETFANFLAEKGTPTLRVWFQHFDKNRIGKIGHRDFRAGMSALRYAFDTDGLWAEINNDNSDELFYEDVALKAEDAAAGNLWNDFRRWAGKSFNNPKDMLRQLKKASDKVQGDLPGQVRSAKEILLEHEVVFGLRECGWEGGEEELIWALMDLSGDGGLAMKDLKWLEIETRRGQAKEMARKKAEKLSEQRAKSKVLCNKALCDFKAMLRKQYGPLFRAWRRVLDTDGSMTLQRPELFKVCRELNWDGNMRWLWKALDHDGSGATTFEELDPFGARELAEFKRWAGGVWGPRFSAPMFREVDRRNRWKLSYAEFAEACDARGFPYQKAITIATALDYKMAKSVQEPDVEVLEIYRPPDWLLADANYEAAEEFKQALLKKYGHFVRGWRTALDKDNSNCCSWYEFSDAAKRIKFTGDVPGAWRALDNDLSGFITLKEIDHVAHDACMEFKLWADCEFGGIRAAYRIMDSDRSNQISWREFRSACRSYGYRGDVTTLFESLDQQGTKNVLHFEEVSFLDAWDTSAAIHTEVDETMVLEAHSEPKFSTKSNQWDCQSFTPGPDAYNLPSSFGAGPTTPQARHTGAFTFGSRLRKAWSRPRLGPAHYDPVVCTDTVRARKPAWSFGDPGGPPPQTLGMRMPRDRRRGPLTPDLAAADPRRAQQPGRRSDSRMATTESASPLHFRERCPARLSTLVTSVVRR